MNINDFNNPTGEVIDKFEAIFARQRELMEKYHHIEVASGLLQTEDCPVNLHSKEGQARLKDFSWRVTEELAEAMESYRAGDIEHFHEELVDALHFLVEQHILSGLSPQDYISDILGAPREMDSKCSMDILWAEVSSQDIEIEHLKRVDYMMMTLIETIGLAMNCLKNKPWKQSHILTDISKFKELMVVAMYRYILLMKGLGLSAEDVYNLYFRKSEVNKFRQRSNY